MSSSESSGYRLRSAQPVEIRVYDSGLRPVDRGVGTVAKDGLLPGIYRVELRAGVSSDEKLIKLQPGQIYEDLNLQLSFVSVVPLPSTRTFDQLHLSALQDLSMNQRVRLGTDTELVVFIRIVSVDTPSRPDVGLTGIKIHLLDAQLNKLQKFAESTLSDQQNGWCGISGSLDAGGYLLRIESPLTSKSVDQVLFLPRGWQTVVCIPVGDTGPMPEAGSIQMLPMGQGGFINTLELNGELALSLEVATTGLAAGRSLVPREQIRELLNRKFWNPMLGIIGAYCMFDPVISRSTNVRPSKGTLAFKFKSEADASLLQTVIKNLSELMIGHPDVAALAELYREATGGPEFSLQPVSWPPAVSIGYKQLVSAEEGDIHSIVDGSLADRARSWVAPCGPWTAWRSEKTGAYSVSPVLPGQPETAGILGRRRIDSFALTTLNQYLNEVSRTEEQPRESILRQFTDEDLSANTGLPTSVIRAVRLEPTTLDSLDQTESNYPTDFNSRKEESSS